MLSRFSQFLLLTSLILSGSNGLKDGAISQFNHAILHGSIAPVINDDRNSGGISVAFWRLSRGLVGDQICWIIYSRT